MFLFGHDLVARLSALRRAPTIEGGFEEDKQAASFGNGFCVCEDGLQAAVLAALNPGAAMISIIICICTKEHFLHKHVLMFLWIAHACT